MPNENETDPANAQAAHRDALVPDWFQRIPTHHDTQGGGSSWWLDFLGGCVELRCRASAPGPITNQLRWSRRWSPITWLCDFAMSLPLSPAQQGTGGHSGARRIHEMTEKLARPEGIEPPTLSFEG
jgi:hypothetical protein